MPWEDLLERTHSVLPFEPTPRWIKEVSQFFRALLTTRRDFLETQASVLPDLRNIMECFLADEEDFSPELRDRLGECIYGYIEYFWTNKLPVSDALRLAVSDIAQRFEGLSAERPYVFSVKECGSGDFVRLLFDLRGERIEDKTPFVLNYAFLNSLKGLTYADPQTKAAAEREVDKSVFTCLSGESKRDMRAALQVLPGILSHVANPLYFAQFTQKAFLESPEVGHRILALEGLLVLVGTTSFEWPDIYAELYRILQKELTQTSFLAHPIPGHPSFLRNRFTVKFFHLLDLALRPDSLGKAVVASFAKLLLILATKSSSDVASLCCFLVFNLGKKRESLRPLFAWPSGFDPQADPFDATADFYSNRVLESCLWETELLGRHYDSRVAQTARSMSGKGVAALRFEFGELRVGHFDQYGLD